MDSIQTPTAVSAESKATGNRKNVLRDRSGSATLEYGLVAGMIALVASLGLGPVGQVLAQEFSALSRDHWSGSASTEASSTCQRVAWVDPERALQHRGR